MNCDSDLWQRNFLANQAVIENQESNKNLDYIKLNQVFTQLALQAGDAIMQIYSKDNILVETKNDDSPVTNADKIADAII